MYVHVAHPAVPAAWEGMCPCVPKGPGGSWHRGGAGRMWKVGAQRPPLLRGHTCGTRRSKHSIESEVEQGSLSLRQVMGRSRLKSEGSVVSLGYHLHMDVLENPAVREQPAKPG